MKSRRYGTNELLHLGTLILPALILIGFKSNRLNHSQYLALQTLAFFLLGFSSHEATHSQASPHPSVNRFIAEFAALVFCSSVALHLASHRKHHQFTLQEKDRESAWVFSGSPWTRPIRMSLYVWCFYLQWHEIPGNEKFWIVVRILLSATLTVSLGDRILVVWLIPLLGASTLFSFFAVYLPHGRGPFARMVQSRLPWVTNFHEMHHRYPNEPWHRMAALHRTNRG